MKDLRPQSICSVFCDQITEGKEDLTAAFQTLFGHPDWGSSLMGRKQFLKTTFLHLNAVSLGAWHRLTVAPTMNSNQNVFSIQLERLSHMLQAFFIPNLQFNKYEMRNNVENIDPIRHISAVCATVRQIALGGALDDDADDPFSNIDGDSWFFRCETAHLLGLGAMCAWIELIYPSRTSKHQTKKRKELYETIATILSVGGADAFVSKSPKSIILLPACVLESPQVKYALICGIVEAGRQIRRQRLSYIPCNLCWKAVVDREAVESWLSECFVDYCDFDYGDVSNTKIAGIIIGFAWKMDPMALVKRKYKMCKCKQVRYCSISHQKQDWIQHRNNCPYYHTKRRGEEWPPRVTGERTMDKAMNKVLNRLKRESVEWVTNQNGAIWDIETLQFRRKYK